MAGITNFLRKCRPLVRPSWSLITQSRSSGSITTFCGQSIIGLQQNPSINKYSYHSSPLFGDLGSNAIVGSIIESANYRLNRKDVKILLSKPNHDLQSRKREIEEIDSKFEEMKEHQLNTVSVYMLGAPACGKTQLARQYGEWYFNHRVKSKRKLGTKLVIVAALDVRNTSSLWRSYSRLATELGCKIPMGQIEERLEVLKADIQNKLRENPGWLLIVDGVNEEMAHQFDSLWPQPGADDWNSGRVLITTNFPSIKEKHKYNRCAVSYDCPKMHEDDAITLLQNLSDVKGNEEGAQKLVNETYVNKNPLDIASTAIVIKEERAENKDFTFTEFMEARIKDYEQTGLTYGPLREAVKTLAESNEDLTLIFTAMGMCAHDPIPSSVLERFLEKKGEEFPSCPLLLKLPEQDGPIDCYERIYTHYSTLHEFRKELIFSDDKKDTKWLQQLQRKLVQCMLVEFERISLRQSNESKWEQHLLFRHLQQLLEYEESKKHFLDPDLKIYLCVTLSHAYIDLYQDPEKSNRILSDLRKELKNDDSYNSPRNKAIINLGWAKAHRNLGHYEASASCLSEVLGNVHHARMTHVELTECLKECSAISLLYNDCLSDYDLRDCLQKALALYEQRGDEQVEVVAEAKCCLAFLCMEMGEWSLGKQYLNEAEKLLPLDNAESMETYNYSAYESLATVFSKAGDHEKSRSLLHNTIAWLKTSYGPRSAALSIPYARLCAANYYRGNKEEADEALKLCLKALDHTSLSENELMETRILEQNEVVMKRPDFPPWAAVHILTTLLCDFGDINYPTNELIRRLANSKFEDSQLLLGRLYRHTGYYPKAEKVLEEHLRECEGSTPRKDTIRIGLIWSELGKVYREQGYIIRGLKAFENAYEILKQFYGDFNHPEVAFIQAELGRVVQLNGNKELGIQMMKEALKVLKDHISNEVCAGKTTYINIKYAQILAAYGIVLRYYLPLENMHRAMECLEEAIDLQTSTLDNKSINRIRSLYYLSTVYHKMGKMEKAYETMRETHRLMTEVDPSHPLNASICTGFGRILESRDPEKAEHYMQNAFKIRNNSEKFSSNAHWKLAFAYRSVGDMMLKKDLRSTAYDNFMKANDMFVRLIEREASEMESWLDSRPSSAPDYGIDIIERWKIDKTQVGEEIYKLVMKK